MRADRAGFTLVELLVALVVGAVVLVGARGLIEGLASQAMSVQRHAREADRRAGARALARQIVGNLAIAPDTASSLVGSAQDARFGSWCPAARGALEACVARLFVRDHDEVHDVVLRWSPGFEVVLVRDALHARLRYLARADDGGSWRAAWPDGITVPPAIGVVTDADTLLLRIGDRR